MIAAIFLKVFDRPTTTERLDAAAAAGFRSVHFDMSILGGPILPSTIADRDVRDVHDAFATKAMDMCSIEATYNMAHPDVAQRERGRGALARLIAAAPQLGTNVLTLCTGSRADGMWERHADNGTAAAWDDMLREVAAAAEVAELHRVVLGIECEYSNVVSSAQLGRRLLDELKSPSLKIVLDAANLVPPGLLGQQKSLLRNAFELLADDIVIAHAKDTVPDGSFVAAGKGGLDYQLFITLLNEYGFDGAIVLHGLDEHDVAECLGLVRSEMARVAGDD